MESKRACHFHRRFFREGAGGRQQRNSRAKQRAIPPREAARRIAASRCPFPDRHLRLGVDSRLRISRCMELQAIAAKDESEWRGVAGVTCILYNRGSRQLRVIVFYESRASILGLQDGRNCVSACSLCGSFRHAMESTESPGRAGIWGSLRRRAGENRRSRYHLRRVDQP